MSEESHSIILIADDDPVANRVLKETLEHLGYGTDVTFNGEEAVAACKTNHYQLIFLDLYMPKMNGLDCSRTIRALDGYLHIPIIGVSANELNEEEYEMLAASGFSCFFTKPLYLDVMEDILHHFRPGA